MTYKDGKFTDKDITIKFNTTLLMYLYKVNELLNRKDVQNAIKKGQKYLGE